MQITFRQGLIGYQPLPKYFQLDSTSVSIKAEVSLNADMRAIQIAFAHSTANYLFVEDKSVVDAWTGLNLTDTFYLYWDLDLITTKRTFGFTKIAPTFGTVYPTSPAIDTHFFDLAKTTMFFWNGQNWIECIRVFAGTLTAGILTIMPQGTQVNLNTPNDIGTILIDVYGNPVRRLSDAGFIFLTTTDAVQPYNSNLDSLSMAQLDLSGVADRYIPRFYCVKSVGLTPSGTTMIQPASFFDRSNGAFAITSADMHAGDVRQLITHGFVQSDAFNFDLPPQTGLFVGGAGEITPHTNTTFSMQKIGHIVNTNTIFISIGRHIVLS
jgi:hypothetical protein